jgi:plasmid stabilization system protein ParE
MTYALAFTERAAIDIINAFEWYDAQRSGLGDEFRNALSRTFDLIQQMPQAGPEVHLGLRRLLLKRFPFAIYYRLDADLAEIRGCLHQRRDPGSWLRRR